MSDITQRQPAPPHAYRSREPPVPACPCPQVRLSSPAECRPDVPLCGPLRRMHDCCVFITLRRTSPAHSPVESWVYLQGQRNKQSSLLPDRRPQCLAQISQRSDVCCDNMSPSMTSTSMLQMARAPAAPASFRRAAGFPIRTSFQATGTASLARLMTSFSL